MHYRRARAAGGSFFFTVNLADRRQDYLTRYVQDLREVFRKTRDKYPFHIEAMVVLPDHLHAIWRLPEGESDYAGRWSLIKSRFSCAVPAGEWVSDSRLAKRERGIWQRRYWEHQIRDAEDWRRHVDYIHFNPVKHGYVRRVVDWPFSSFHRFVREGVLPRDWGGGEWDEVGNAGE